MCHVWYRNINIVDNSKTKNQEDGLAGWLRVKGFQWEPGHLSGIPGTHSTRRNQFPKLTFDLSKHSVADSCPSCHINKQANK